MEQDTEANAPVNCLSRARAWIVTINNYTQDDKDRFHELRTKYSCYGLETGESGTPHMQGYVVWNNPTTFSAMKKKLPRANIERCRAVESNDPHKFKRAFLYCFKGEQPKPEWEELHELGPNYGKNAVIWEQGTRPQDSVDAGQTERMNHDAIWQAAVEGRVMDIPARVRLQYYNVIKRVAHDNRPKVKPMKNKRCGVWIHGPSNTGKTTAVMDMYPDAYIKSPSDEWWPQYDGQATVLIDEVKPAHIQNLIKNGLWSWVNFIPFPARCFGEMKHIRPERIIITSQHNPFNMITDPEDIAAFKSRFDVIDFKK